MQNLGGTWRLAVADDGLRRRYQEGSFDDSDWQRAPVPGHWQRHDEFADHDGPMLYRRRFTTETPQDGRRQWLVFDGIFYQSDVWLDSMYLGDTEGYFFAHQFEISPLLRQRTEHCLSVEVTSKRPGDPSKKRAITGLFDASESLDPRANAGGIWQGVRIEESGPIRILHRRIVCTTADHRAATVTFRVVLHTEAERAITLRSRVGAVDRSARHRLAAGENRIEWTVTVLDPELWWPAGLGEATLVEAAIEVIDTDGSVSDSCSVLTGLRSVELHDWIASINGERLFLRGAGHDPIDFWLAEASIGDFRRDLGLARDANLNLLRVHAHISRPELYQCADEMGMLLWQDFPLKWRYHRSIRKQAIRQAREAVDLLGHHPSVVMWSAHNEPIPSRLGAATSPWQLAIAQQPPSYNRLVIDRSVATTLRRTDGSRPVITRSGVLPNLPRLDGSDNHLSLGWRVGDERQLPALCMVMPRLVRFVGEFGSQAIPVDDDFVDRSRWPELDWETLESTYRMRRANLEHYVPTEAFEHYDQWAQATRSYQTQVIRFHIETLRRLKYRPTGGFTISSLADAMTAVSTSVLSVSRTPKPAYDAVRDACRDVLAIAERLPSHLHAGEQLPLDLHVVNDLRVAIESARLTVSFEWQGGRTSHSWVGDIPEDSCTRVGTFEVTAPDIDGPVSLVLALDVGGEVVTTRYDSWVLTGPHEH